jgi:hypothetical protein
MQVLAQVHDLLKSEMALAKRLHGDRRGPDEGRQKCSQYHDDRERLRWSSFLALATEDSEQMSAEEHGFRTAEVLSRFA